MRCRKLLVLILFLLSVGLFCYPDSDYNKHQFYRYLEAKKIYKKGMQVTFNQLKALLPSYQLRNLINTRIFITLEDKIVFAGAYKDNTIRISAATLLFIEDLAVTYAWYDYKGITNYQPVINYVLLLRRQMRKDLMERKIIPTMPQALGVPSEAIWNRPDSDSIKKFANNFITTTVTWIIAHEMGHIALGHLTQQEVFADKYKMAQHIRRIEVEADAFAVILMSAMRRPPIGMAITMKYYCLLYPVRLDFKYEEDWQEYLAKEFHPIWPDRFYLLSLLFKKYSRDFREIKRINYAVQLLEGVSILLRKRDMLDAMIIGSEKLTFENIMYFEPLKNIDKKYYGIKELR
jgi:Zn-dependent protease with chaperone function